MHPDIRYAYAFKTGGNLQPYESLAPRSYHLIFNLCPALLQPQRNPLWHGLYGKLLHLGASLRAFPELHDPPTEKGCTERASREASPEDSVATDEKMVGQIKKILNKMFDEVSEGKQSKFNGEESVQSLITNYSTNFTDYLSKQGGD